MTVSSEDWWPQLTFISCVFTPYPLFFSPYFWHTVSIYQQNLQLYLEILNVGKNRFFHFKGKHLYISINISHGWMYYGRLTKIKFTLTCSYSLLSWGQIHRRIFLIKQRLRHWGFLSTQAFCIMLFKTSNTTMVGLPSSEKNRAWQPCNFEASFNSRHFFYYQWPPKWLT